MKLGALLLGISVLAVGCGDGSSAPDVDAAIVDAILVPPPDAGPCNTVANVATDVAEIGVAEVAPAPGGGTIADGTYAVTAAVIYTGIGGNTGADGVTYHATSVNLAGAYQYVDTGSNEGVTAGIFQTSGTSTIMVLQQCPTADTLGFGSYTASPTEFTVYDATNPAAVYALTFTLQP